MRSSIPKPRRRLTSPTPQFGAGIFCWNKSACSIAGGILYESLGYRTTLILAALAIIIPTALVLTVRDVREVTIHYFTGLEDDDATAQPSSEGS